MSKNYHFIDIHYHASPDLYKRRYSAIQVGKLYKNLHGAVILKSHLGSTTEVATLAYNEGLPVYGSIVLNKIGGGINYRRVLSALANYQVDDHLPLLVYLPTITGRKHQSKLKRQFYSNIPSQDLLEPETITNQDGKLKKSVIDVLKLSLDYPIVVSSGHASKEEVFLLIETAQALGIKKLILNQPANPLTGLNFEELKKLENLSFLWFEQTALTVLLGYQTMEDFRKVSCELPRVIYSSDLGQCSQIDIPNWLHESQAWFKSFNMTKERQIEICKNNPMKLLT